MPDLRHSLTRRELLAAGTATVGFAAMPSLSNAQPLPPIPGSSRELWQWARVQPVLDPQRIYLDAASAGPTLRAAMAAEYRARETQSLGVAQLGDAHWSSETNHLAKRFATFLGCEADEVVFTRGAGEALGMVAAGLDLTAGDEVITTSREHPAALSPWLALARRRGILVRPLELPAPLAGPEQLLEAVAGAITERTKVLAFSHVQYADGAVLPVKELCALARQRNLVTVIDGAQAVGMLDFNLRDLDCDFYAASFHKWLGGSHGTGMLFVRRAMLERLWPLQPRGIDASPPIFTPTDAPGQSDVPAALHKLGNIVPVAGPALRGGEVALEFQNQITRARIQARIRELAIYARLRLQQLDNIELLTPVRPGMWAGILTFRIAGRSAGELAAAVARNHRVHVRDLHWPGSTTGVLRASFHVFNSHDDVDRLLQALR